MSIFSFSRVSHSRVRLMLGLLGQVLLVIAAAAGVLVIAGGCAPSPQQLQQMQARQQLQQPSPNHSMASAVAVQPDTSLQGPFDAPPAAVVPPQRPAVVQPQVGQQGQQTPRTNPRIQSMEGAASPREAKLARRETIDQMINEATIPPAQPAPRGGVALRAAEKSVAPLADTLAAIDTATRAIVENLRNAECPGFKSSRTACGDGRNVASQIDLTQGELQSTERALDIAIQGDGFLEIRMYVDGRKGSTIGFTRNGHLYVAKDNQLVVGQAEGQEGFKLIPEMKVPVGTTEIAIAQDGTIRATQAGADKPGPVIVGRLTLARFTDPTALQPMGGGIYTESDGSGPAVDSLPGERGAGTVVQGFLEASNVDLIKERLRLRFLQSWRATILAAIDGEPAPAPAPASARTSASQP